MDGFIFILVVDALLLAFSLKVVTRNAARGWRRLLRTINASSAGLDVELEADGGVRGPPDSERSLRRFVASVARCVGLGEAGLAFGWDGLSLVLPTGKTILAAQSGSVAKGSLWAIMGASGAGKSTVPESTSFLLFI